MIRCGWMLTDLSGGGAERIPLLLAPALRETELTVVLLKERIEHQVPDGVRVATLSSGRHSLARAWGPILTRAVRTARRLDVLVAGLEWAPTYFAVACGALARKPVVATVHVDLRRYRELEPVSDLWWSAMGRALRRCAAVVAVSEDARAGVLDFGIDGRHVHVIPNPVKPFPVREATSANGRARILTVASLKPIKGVDLVLDAADRLRDLDFEWTIVGDGPEREKLARRTEELGLDRRVRFVGFEPDPGPFYAAADIFVLPSRAEGFALSLVEAMGAGLPCVATRCAGVIEDHLSGGAGELVPSGDADALVVAVRGLLVDRGKWKALGDNARRRARAFEPDLVARRYDELLASVVSEQRLGLRRA